MSPNLKKRQEDYTYEVSRYTPRVKSILQDSVNGLLDPTAFALVKGKADGAGPSSSTAKAAPVSLRQKPQGAPSASGPLSSAIASGTVPSRSVIAFIIGGVTYSEIRSAYEVAEATKREIYIGMVISPHSSNIFRLNTFNNTQIVHSGS